MFVDENENRVFDAGEQSETTDSLGYASVIYLAPGTVQARASTGSGVCVDSLDNSRNDIPMYTIVDADMCTPLTGLMIRLMNDHGNSDLAAASAIAAAFNLDGYVDVFTTSIVVEMTATFDPTELAYLLEWLKVQGQVKLTLEAFADAASPEVAAASIGEVTWDCTGVLADLISTSNVFSMTSASSLLVIMQQCAEAIGADRASSASRSPPTKPHSTTRSSATRRSQGSFRHLRRSKPAG